MYLKFIKKYSSYSIILLIFVFAFFFGKNMNLTSPTEKILQDQLYAQQKVVSGIYDISAGQQEYELKNQFSIKKSQCGRLFFSLKNLSTADSFLSNQKIKVFLTNNFDQNQELGSYEIKSDRFFQNQEIDFCANADYQNLIFQKDKDNQNGSFEISNVLFSPLVSEKHDLSNLLPPIVGNTNFSNIIYQTNLDINDANKAYKFTRHNQMIGQTFVADTESISGVDMKLEFTGVGGIGNYYLELREADNQNGKIALFSDRIAYFGFDKTSAERDLKIQKGIYHIPLVSHLEKGKTYYIGINNTAVKFNILNTLKIYGGNANNGEKIITSVKRKTSDKPGNLYLKVYGANYVKTKDEKVLTGTKILDNGDGTGSYIYEQKGNFSDYLDLDQVISKENTSIFYDNVQSGISGKDEDDNAFVYKINTVYPFTKMKIELGQPGGEFTNSLIYYSFDNKNWQEIKSDWDKSEDEILQGDKNRFQELLQGDNKTKTVYIKVAYDKEDAKEKTIHLFGLKNLKVVAEITIGN